MLRNNYGDFKNLTLKL